MSANNAPLCIGFSEIDRHAESIYKHHFPEHVNLGDATKIVPEQLPDFDFLIAGFPCQAFSIAGKRQGFDDSRGTLFFEIARILSHKRPAHFLLENVGGLRSHDGGKTLQRILGILSDLGYFVEVPLLNSKDYGVPQNRERVFFIGHLGERCQREVLSVGQGDGDFIEEQRDIAYCLDAHYYKGSNDAGRNRRTVVNGASKVTNKMLQMEETKGNSQGGRVYHTEGISSDRPTKRQNGRRMKEQGEARFTLTAQDQHGVFNGQRIRRLTPIECERLQGLPDGWTALGSYNGEVKEVSDTQRYKTLGNAMTINVIEALITEMLKAGCLNPNTRGGG